VSRVIFWTAVACAVYTYLGYPALLAAIARLRPRPIRRRPIRPSVSILIVAHNEAAWIGRKIESCLALDYPDGRLEIVVASDGSTDATPAIVRTYEPRGVRLVAFELRRGKPSVLNAVIPKLCGEIVLLADARQTFDRDALTALVANFADPEVGAASGELVVRSTAELPVADGVGFYWRYEKVIRRLESRYDSTVGTTGAVYALRRPLFEPIPNDTLLDDVLIPMRLARRGYRVVFEPQARAWDEAAATAQQEFARKVRTIAGNFQLFVNHRWLLSPWRNRLWVQTLSHKALRLLAPAFLVAILAANVALYGMPFYRATLTVQGLFYLAAALGHVTGGRRTSRWLTVPYAFCFLNVITVVSFYRFITARQAVTWTKAQS